MSKEGSTKLTYAIKNLRKHWEHARVHWQDQVAKDFESNHLFPLETRANAVAKANEKAVAGYHAVLNADTLEFPAITD